MELRLPLEVFPGREATCRAVFGTWGSFPDDARASHCPFVLTSFTGWSSKRCPGIGFLSRGDREIGVLRNVEPPTRPRLEYRRETGLILRCDRKVGNPFQTPPCSCDDGGATWFFSSYGGILELRRGIQDASCVGPGKSNLPFELRRKAGDCSRVTAGPIDLILACVQKPMFLSRGDRDLGVAIQTHPGRQAFISSGSKEARSALESRRVFLGAHWVDSRESSLLRRLERGREIGR